MDALPALDHFTHAEAWQLGSQLAEQCRVQHLAVTIGIWIGDQRVFHVALPGTTVDNDRWVERKANIARHFGMSSAQVAQSYAGDNPERFLQAFALPNDRYYPAGGAVPITVRGTVVGILAMSGLASDEDHRYAVDALRRLAGMQSNG